MDYMPSPESFCTPDFFKSSLNPSPSSLYTYDQDHQDMNAAFHDTPRTLLGQMCASQDVFSLPPAEPEFDLHPQFENSNSLDRFFSGAGMTQVTHTESSADFQGDRLKREIMTILQPDFSKVKPGPTLTEVNVDPYLFDDCGAGSLTVCEGGKLPQKRAGDIKKETSTQIHPDLGPKTFTPLTTVKTTNQNPAAIIRMLQQSQSSPSHTSATSLSELLVKNRTRKVAAVSPILTPTTTTASSTTTIKTEPADTESTPTDSNPCLHKILTSPSLQPTPHARAASSQASSMPSRGQVGGQGRAPPLGQQGKSGSVEEKWKEIEKFIHDPSSDQSQPSTSTGSSAMDRKRKRHGSGGSGGMSDGESVKSQRIESITDDDSDSDDDSDVSDTPFEESLTELAKNSKQYFWQYNIQAKGPKGTRLQLNISDNDPHRPVTFEDPVFDPTNTSLVGIRHAGKARRGDGNEITPNPRKLYMIGQKLCKLNRDINSVQMASNLPANVRSKSRKEKNKLSSRACRLKKKAQHEANKIKLFGLNCEQGELLDVVRLIWPNLRERAKQQMKENIPLLSNPMAAQISSIIKTHNKTRVAGNTADYVNRVIARVEDGDPKGGLDIKLKVKS